MYVFHRSTEGVIPRGDVFSALHRSCLYYSYRDGDHTLEPSDYKECHVAGIGTEGEDIVFARAGHKSEATYVGSPVFFRLSDQLTSYINQHLDSSRIFQCNPDYPVWSDGEKVAKVIFNTDMFDEYNNIIRIYEKIHKLDIPLPKLIDHRQVSNSTAIIIMEYVGPDFDRFDDYGYVLTTEDKEYKNEIDELIQRIRSYGYRPDTAYRNFCLHNGRVVAIDWADWGTGRY